MQDRLTIAVPCDLRFRNAVGALLGEVCRELQRGGADAMLETQVISAFNEAFNNLALHDGHLRGEVEVVVEIGVDRLEIQLLDEGPAFDLDEVQEPELMSMPESGLGLFIIRSMMDEVDYIPGAAGSRNVFRMKRDLSLETPLPRGPAAKGSMENA